MKNCMQCGGEGQIVTEGGKPCVECDFCKLKTVPSNTEFEAVEIWDEVQGLMEMHEKKFIHMLSKVPKETRDHVILKSSLDVVVKYLQLCADKRITWDEMKGGLFTQLKMIDLTNERFHKGVEDILKNGLGNDPCGIG